ncbi:MAG TPA: UDP-N-acetylmuramate--L-alanine ligase [Candidatus Limnocylindria bacterium]|nr:UDP-N-acetylmuramate--L-alanine ligase [Candidatus Limnocylindria bacterium]
MRIHIVGIGGAGMSAVGKLLLAAGHGVTGSDNGRWPLAEALAREGAAVYERFAAEHVPGTEVVLRSSAYKEDNVEVAEAIRRGIPVWKREDAWRFLANGKRVIAVAGTHGKSTTTALVWSALRTGNVDASLICGAVLRGIGSNAHAGSADVLVIEADEYDNTFHALRPLIAVVTTVDHDHVDMFPTRESYRDAFRTFVRGIVPRGTLVTCMDDEGARDLAAYTRTEVERDVVTYGTDSRADLRVTRDTDKVYSLGGETHISLQIPGAHNGLNAAAAVLAAHTFGVTKMDAALGVSEFSGVERRLEALGTAAGVKVVDDYAHMPAEIAVGLNAFENAVVVFQPHTPSRLAKFFDEFVAVLRRARAVVIVETFSSAREHADAASRARALAEAVDGRYAKDGEEAAHIVAELVSPGDVVLVMGAGDVRPVGERLLELLRTPV